MLRRCYKGTWIDADPLWHWEGSRQIWEGHFFMESEGPGGMEKKEVVAPGKFLKEDAALQAIYDYAKKLVDSQEE